MTKNLMISMLLLLMATCSRVCGSQNGSNEVGRVLNLPNVGNVYHWAGGVWITK